MFSKNTLLIALIISFAIGGCSSQSFGMFDDSDASHINRFDKALFQWITAGDSETLQTVIMDYPQMLAMLGNALFKTSFADSAAFFSQLMNYYTEPALQSLYKDAITIFDAHSPAIRQIEMELSHGFMQLKRMFPSMQTPAVYMHVSGLQQNIIVADSLLSVSIDNYLGTDYPLYREFFYDYQLKSMTPDHVAKDGLLAWLISEYPFHGQNVLDRMIYEGKIVYLLTIAGYRYSFQHIMSLTENDYKWCLKNERVLWKTIYSGKQLEMTDAGTVSRYFQPAPSLFISEEAPGNLGNFFGYRIVERYMKQTKSTVDELMLNSDAPDILKKSKYKP